MRNLITLCESNMTLTAYHGSNADFLKFEDNRGRTAKHLYFTPEKNTAKACGRNLYEVELTGKIGDFSPRASDQPRYHVELEAAYTEGALSEYWDTFEEFKHDFEEAKMYQTFANSHAQDDTLGALFDLGYDIVIIPDAGFDGYISESYVVEKAANVEIVERVLAEALNENHYVTTPPAIVYHGSKERAIQSFEKRPSKRYLLGMAFERTAHGFFFATNPEDAKEYGRHVSAYRIRCNRPLVRGTIGVDRIPQDEFADFLYIFKGLLTPMNDGEYHVYSGMMTDLQIEQEDLEDGQWMYEMIRAGGLDWECLDCEEFVRRMVEKGYDGSVVYEPEDRSKISWFVVSPDQIEFVEEVGREMFESEKGPDVTKEWTDTLWSLFLNGPVYDGDLPSKTERDELVHAGLADRGHGFQWITDKGIELAIDLGMDVEKEKKNR